MNTRKPLDGQATGVMVVLCAIWGLQQVALKAAAPDMAPVLQIALRSVVTAGVVFLLVCWRRELAALRGGTWKPGLAVGVLFTLEFLFVGEGLRFTSASHMAIFLYTAPIFTALGLHFKMPEERLTAVQWTGIALAFAGVAVSFSGRGGVEVGNQAWVGDLLGLAAGVAWAGTTLTVRFSRLSGAPATVTLLYQLIGASVLLLAAVWLSGQTAVTVTPVLLSSLGFQIIVVSLFSFLVWFSLLRRYLASRLGALSFLTPVFGVLFGVLILQEQLDRSFVLGAGLIVAGILLVSARDLLARGKP